MGAASPTMLEVIGMTLGLAFLAFAIITAVEILVAILVGIYTDARTWLAAARTRWKARKPAKGWQPKRRPRLAIRRPK